MEGLARVRNAHVILRARRTRAYYARIENSITLNSNTYIMQELMKKIIQHVTYEPEMPPLRTLAAIFIISYLAIVPLVLWLLLPHTVFVFLILITLNIILAVVAFSGLRKNGESK